ncbi:MAG: hypothetical protein ACP5NQ_08400, partial [Vulcanisaeta sp.]
VDPNNGYVFLVANPYPFIYVISGVKIIGTINVTGDTYAIAYDPYDNSLYVAALSMNNEILRVYNSPVLPPPKVSTTSPTSAKLTINTTTLAAAATAVAVIAAGAAMVVRTIRRHKMETHA